jgi:hypothetical protein
MVLGDRIELKLTNFSELFSSLYQFRAFSTVIVLLSPTSTLVEYSLLSGAIVVLVLVVSRVTYRTVRNTSVHSTTSTRSRHLGDRRGSEQQYKTYRPLCRHTQ